MRNRSAVLLVSTLPWSCQARAADLITLIPDDSLDPTQAEKWQDVGSSTLAGGLTIAQFVDVTDYGVTTSSPADNASMLNTLIVELGKEPGLDVLYFPPGTYGFEAQVVVQKGDGSIILKGECGETALQFQIREVAPSCLQVNAETVGIEDLNLSQPKFIQVGDPFADLKYFNSTMTFGTSDSALTSETGVKDGWVLGVFSNRTKRYHVHLDGASHITISGSSFSYANNYGDDGRAYGVLISGNGTFDAEYNLIENSIFDHLRHSLVIQHDAQYNVMGYNYSRNPYGRNGFLLNAYQAGIVRFDVSDLVFHGSHYAASPNSYNLAEGNYVDQIAFDNEHHANGSENVLLRNIAVNEVNIPPWHKAFYIEEPKAEDNKDEDGKKDKELEKANRASQFGQHAVVLNAHASKHVRKRVHEYGTCRYWDPYAKLWGCDNDWTDAAGLSDDPSYYYDERPKWLTEDYWPYYPERTSKHWAKERFDAHSDDLAATRVCAAWCDYTNMCAPGTTAGDILLLVERSHQVDFRATGSIVASYAITLAPEVEYRAANQILLLPGFEVTSNARFHAVVTEVTCPTCASGP